MLHSISLVLLAKKIDREHELAVAVQATALRHYRRCGQLLVKAKKLVGHGNWQGWLKAPVTVTPRRAQQYMAFASKTKSTSLLEWDQWQEISGNTGKQPFVCHNSAEEEWFTPTPYLDAARGTLGTIDLDPATCHSAQKNVRAKRYYTKKEDGYSILGNSCTLSVQCQSRFSAALSTLALVSACKINLGRYKAKMEGKSLAQSAL